MPAAETASGAIGRALPEVSVVIPTRDRPEYLARSLVSALEQRKVRAEVLVVDDGSRTSVASRLTPEARRRARIVRHDAARGVCAARNTGISTARAPWLAFLDDDDLWAPTKLRTLLDLAAETGAGYVFSGGITIDADGKVLGAQEAPSAGEQLHRALLAESVIPYIPSNLVARTELVKSAGGFDTDLNVLGDWDLAVRLSATARAAMTPEHLVAYTLHETNMQRDEAAVEAELPRFYRKHARARAALGVSVDRRVLVLGRANSRRSRGDNRGAAIDYLRLGWLRRDPRPLARGIVLGLGGDPVIKLARRLARRDKRLSKLAPLWLEQAVRPQTSVLRRSPSAGQGRAAA